MSTALTRMLPGLAAGLLTIALIGLATWQHRSDLVPEQRTAALSAIELETAVEQWNSGTQGRIRVYDSLETDEARLLVARALLESSRAPDRQICSLLRTSGSRKWCRSTIGRPHLYEARRPTSGARERPAGGPVDDQLLGSPDLMNLLPNSAPPTCDANTEPGICAAETAIEAGLANDPAAVREICLHIEVGRWRDECIFMASERMYMSIGDPSLSRTAWLCAHAGKFSHHCMRRIIDAMVARVPAADIDEGWHQVVDRAKAFETGIEPVDPILGRQVIDWYYAEALDHSYAKARVIQGELFSKLPPEAHPHVRASAIERLVHSRSAGHRSLEDWIELVDPVLASASPPLPPVPPAAVGTHPVSNLWVYEEPEQSNVAAIYWRGPARRMRSDDPAADRLICLMESLARTRRPASREFGKLDEHPDEAVRMTAKRLGQVVAMRLD